MSRRSAFSLNMGICPKHGVVEVPFYPPPLTRDSADRLIINLNDVEWVKDFEKRATDTCTICGAKLTAPYLGDDPEEAKRQIVDQLVGSLFEQFPSLRELDGAPAEMVDAILRQTKTRIRVEISPGSPFRLSPYLLAIGAGQDNADYGPTSEGVASSRAAKSMLTYSEYASMRPERRQAFVLDLLKTQDGKCALCEEFLDTRRRPGYMGPVVDHEHSTGRIRGILHPKCNTDLSVIETRSAEWLEKARSYLQGTGPVDP